MDHSRPPSETLTCPFRKNCSDRKYCTYSRLSAHVKRFVTSGDEEESKVNQHEKLLITSNMSLWDVTISHADLPSMGRVVTRFPLCGYSVTVLLDLLASQIHTFWSKSACPLITSKPICPSQTVSSCLQHTQVFTSLGSCYKRLDRVQISKF